MVETVTDDKALARVTVVALGPTQEGKYPAAPVVLLDLYVRPDAEVGTLTIVSRWVIRRRRITILLIFDLFVFFFYLTRQVKDYRTRVSGITPALLAAPTAVTWQAAQDAVLRVVSSASVLIGHSVHNDLLSLRIRHSFLIGMHLCLRLLTSKIPRCCFPSRG